MPNKLLEIIELIYAVALGTETSDHLLETLSDYFRCETVYFVEPVRSSGALFADKNSTPSAAPREPDARQHKTPDPTKNAREYVKETLAGNTRDPATPHLTNQVANDAVEITDKTASINMAGEHTSPFSLRLRRAPSEAGFDKNDRELLQTLAPHLEQARCIHKNLAARSSTAPFLIKQLIEFLPFSVILLDREGRVCLTNEMAANAPRTDGLALNVDGLKASVEEENRALQRLIKECCDLREQATGNTPFQDIKISKRSGTRPYIVTLAVIPTGHADENDGGPAVALFVHDPDQYWVTPYKRFKSLFGLTQTEARVATAVMQGKTLQQCADNIGHSLSTSRNMLKRVFAKTDTCRQNQLASLLAHTTVNILQGESKH